MRNSLLAFAVAAIAFGCGGSSTKGDTTPVNPCANPCANPCGEPAKASLYDRLGKLDAIKLVVDEFVATLLADERINKFFANSDVEKLKGHLVDQICEATGGPCKYTGRSMKESHAGLGITEEHFNALVEDLDAALNTFDVGEEEKKELLGALAGMKGDIVEK